MFDIFAISPLKKGNSFPKQQIKLKLLKLVCSKASNDSAASADYNGISNVMEHNLHKNCCDGSVPAK